MKRTFSILAMIFTIHYLAMAQQINLDTLVVVTYEKASLKEAIADIAKKYDIKFSYSDSKLPLHQVVSVDYTGTSLRAVLNGLLHPFQINYHVIGKHIVLHALPQNKKSL